MDTRRVEDGGNPVMAWFGAHFADLHPQLQVLHRYGGQLRGPVELIFGKGFAGALGRRLARRLGLPSAAGRYPLTVTIRHTATALLWQRCFGAEGRMDSVFEPIGRWPQGYWFERTGPITLRLTVEMSDGGWHWRVIGVRVRGVPLPRWLLPRSIAYKRIEQGRYRFHVAFVLPLLGRLLTYDGLLEAVPAPTNGGLGEASG